ncbi:hypothetical protein ACP4OV_015108 [Aristida adscensionis]
MAASVTRRSSMCRRRAGACHLAVLLLALAAAAPRGVIGEAAAADSGGEPKWHVVAVSSLLPSTVCTGTPAKATPNSSALSVVHRHGPCSPPHSRGGGAPPPSHAEILRRGRRRVESIRHRIDAAASAATGGVSLPARWGRPLGDNNYIITVGLGTPAREFSVELDTGSDLSWVQCTPCRRCYKQRDPLFDPARSSTFSTVPCAAPACQGFSAHNCSSTGGGKCGYMFPYADGSVAMGSLVCDTLTLSPSETLPGFVFGCGRADTGSFGETDGLFGLARDSVSLASQAAGRYGARFSYCLPSTPSAVGYLYLGAGAAPPANTQFTAMVSRSDMGMPSLYYVNLVGLTVAGVELNIPPAVFTRAGTIIDSGTVVTFLPPHAYAALRSAFRRSMSRYKRAPALDNLDTCYDFTGVARVKIPAVALVFADGATVSLDAGGVMYVSTVAQTCLAFAANDVETDVGVLGNTQQKTFTMVYDVGNQKIGFGANGCS